MPKVLAISLDDRCIFNKNYHEAIHKGFSQAEAVKESNKEFIKTLNKERSEYSTAACMVGSHRQDLDRDNYNGLKEQTGSFYSAVQIVADAIEQAELDKILLSDLYNGKAFGTNFDSAIQKLDKNKQYRIASLLKKPRDKAEMDTTKILLVYTQMHKRAREAKDDIITFKFYESNIEIFNILFFFYNNFPVLIPRNIHLSLNHYEGADITSKPPIKGQGLIDTDFEETVPAMVKICKDNPPMYSVGEAGANIFPYQLSLINLEKIYSSISPLDQNIKTPADKLMLNLKDNIEKEIERYKNFPNLMKIKPETTKLFKQRCVAHINNTDRQLEQNNSWKPFLKNLCLMFTIIGTSAALLSFGIKFTKGHYAFFNKAIADHGQSNNLTAVCNALNQCSPNIFHEYLQQKKALDQEYEALEEKDIDDPVKLNLENRHLHFMQKRYLEPLNNSSSNILDEDLQENDDLDNNMRIN